MLPPPVYCPNPNHPLFDTTIPLKSASDNMRGEGCIVEKGAFISFDATQLPQIDSAAIDEEGVVTPMVATFEGGVVGEGGGIEFLGPSLEGVDGLHPINVNIRNNRFGADAAIRLRGSLPSHSQVLVMGNILAVSRPVFKDIGEFFASPIYYYAYQEEFSLSAGSGYTISDNTVSCASPDASYACFGIGLWGTLRLHDGAWLDVEIRLPHKARRHGGQTELME